MQPLSVVIPTLGGESLRETIEQLNRGTLIPAEILVCIPEEEAFRVENLFIHNVVVVKTNIRGQVAQRAIGFAFAKHKMVLQLDDDVLLNEGAVQELAEALYQLGPGNALAPVYFDAATGRCIHEARSGLSGYLMSLYYYVVCGAPWSVKRMGDVTTIGLCFGVDSDYCGSKYFETEWLPGGCVLCFREDLIEENYFPFVGKAYSEDLIHSFLRKSIGIRHWVIPSAECIIDAAEPEICPSSILAQLEARRYFVSLIGGQAWRLSLYEALSRVRRVLSNKN